MPVDETTTDLMLRRLEVAFVTNHAIHKWLSGDLKSPPPCILRYCEAYDVAPAAWVRRYKNAGIEERFDMLSDVEQSELVERGLWRT